MPGPDPTGHLFAALRDLEAWLSTAGLPHVFVGGVAVGIVGRPRATRDVDVVVALGRQRPADFIRRARAAGFPTRFSDAGDLARSRRVCLLRHAATGVGVDVAIADLDFQLEVIRRAVPATLGGLSLPVATPEDVVILKAVAFRPQDLADIETILAVNPRIDVSRIRAFTAAFAEILETPEMLEGLERLLARRPAAGRTRPAPRPPTPARRGRGGGRRRAARRGPSS